MIFPEQDTTLCQGENLKPFPVTELSEVSWSTGEEQDTLLGTSTGNYSLNGTSPQGCPVSGSVYAAFLQEPNFPLLWFEDSVTCNGLPVRLNSSPQPPGINLLWNDGNTGEILEIANFGTYSLTAFNRCFSEKDSVSLTFVNCLPFIPNLITPNNDEKNDRFIIQKQVERPFTLSVYNQWGARILYRENYQNDWIPEDLPDGVYFYLAEDAWLEERYKGSILIQK